LDKSGVKAISAILIFIISSFLIFLLVDDIYLKNKYFREFSKNFHLILNKEFGSFCIGLVCSGIVISLLMLIRMKTFEKIFTVSGFILLVAFFLPFFETFKIAGISGGEAGLKLSIICSGSGNMTMYLLYFFWFFTSLFLVLFPLRGLISGVILSIAGSSEKVEMKKEAKTGVRSKSSVRDEKVLYNAKNPQKKSGKSPTPPWFSRVVYESSSRRIEVPVFTDGNENVKKFKLKKNSDTDTKSEKFEQVDTFSEKVEIHTKTDEEEYFTKAKANWPLHWQKNAERKEDLDAVENILQNEVKLIDMPHVVTENQYDIPEDQIIDYDMVFDAEEVIDDAVDVKIISDDNDRDRNIASYLKKLNDKKNKEKEDAENSDFDQDELIEKKDVDFDEIFNKMHAKKESEDVFHHMDEEFSLPGANILKQEETKSRSLLFKAEEKEAAAILENTLLEFGIKAEVCEIIHGPVVTLFKLIPAPGIKLSRIEGLSTNLALRLAAQSIRIIAPIPGEKVVGIEIPNKKRELVNFKEIVNSEEFTESKFNIPIGIGKDISGNIIVVDLYKMPHILIAGATGAGKSVCVNSFICSILFSKTPEDIRLILIDPKIVELKPYNNIPHLLTPVITESKEAMNALKYLLFEMERRYSRLDEMGVRDIVEYRKKRSPKSNMEDLPFIVAFIDEFADLMTTSGKEAEILFARLAAKARAVGILLVLATQRPSADVITGLIKSNIPARIAFQVISLQDSRIILDQKGAEKLLGQGDMLYLGSTQPFPIRLQGAFLGKEEVDSIAAHWKSISEPKYINIAEMIGGDEDEEHDDFTIDGENKDPLFEQAIEIVYQTRKASASYLQRRLNIGYNRAARMVEEMESMGIVGPQRGAKAREVIGSYDF